MAEPDHIIVKPIPNLSEDGHGAAFPFFYIEPKKFESESLKKIAPTWMNVSLAMKKDPETDKAFGWVLEMYAYATSSALHNLSLTPPSTLEAEFAGRNQGKKIALTAHCMEDDVAGSRWSPSTAAITAGKNRGKGKEECRCWSLVVAVVCHRKTGEAFITVGGRRRHRKNPSRQEIMGITQRLSQYGKIEENNVFYWFQNQKGRERQQRKRLATLAAEAATPHDLRQQATVGGSSEHATKHPMLETLPLFPMHSDRVGKSKADTNNSEPSLELTLRPYSPTP
nr:hydroxyproline O-arabinosyltransferase 1 [Ipomoea batatas]